MIKGLGTDIIEISRIASSIERYGQRFLDKMFTAKEQDYCLQHTTSATHFAGRFAAKEAVVKALGTGFGASASWLDIEILNDEQGKPYVTLSPTLNRLFHNPKILISISHCKSFATATAIYQ